MISKEELAAYVDGELDPTDAARVEAALRDDSKLRAQRDALAAQKTLLTDRYDLVLQEPTPEHLEQLLRDADAKPAPVAKSGLRLSSALGALADALFATRWSGGLTAAACLLVGIVAGEQMLRGATPTGYVTQDAALFAQGDVAQILSTGVSGETVSGVTPVLSFLTSDDTLCRAFTSVTGSGVACRTEEGWRMEALSFQVSEQLGDFRTASSSLPEPVLEAVDRLIDGEVLEPDAERQALHIGLDR